MYIKKWIFNKELNKKQIYIDNPGILEMILKNRGITDQKDIDEFLNCNINYEDPFNYIDMDKAVNKIRQILKEKQKIVIYGDYDVDGITSTVVLFLYLSKLGADVDYYIPSRESEGYGLNINAIDILKKSKYDLIITVDNGVTAIEEIEYANSRGMSVIVTDHHKPLELLPNAEAVINPHRCDCGSNHKHLSGVGVVFKLISALEGNSERIVEDYSDIISLGIIADIMPIIGENRKIVKMGFKKMKESPNLGIKAILESSRVNINNIKSEDISFKIAPRLNSTSRMNKIDLAIKLLLSENFDEANNIAKKLEKTNTQRRSTEAQIMEQINNMIKENPSLISSEVIIIAKEGWAHSIVGINASRLVEKYHKPCILISIDQGVAFGSARSIDGFSIIDAIDFARDSLIKYGGHPSAAGFKIDPSQITIFSNKIAEYATKIKKRIPISYCKVDGEIFSHDITLENIEKLGLLKPFGLGNQNPQLLIKNALIHNIKSLSNGKYSKIFVKFNDDSTFGLLNFNTSYDDLMFGIGDKIDAIVTLGINNYNNLLSPELLIKDMRWSGFDQDEYFNDIEFHYKLKERNINNGDKAYLINTIPIKSELAIIYKHLQTISECQYCTLEDFIEQIYLQLIHYKIRYLKISASLDIFNELNLISLSDSSFKFLNVKEKVDIYQSKIYKILAV